MRLSPCQIFIILLVLVCVLVCIGLLCYKLSNTSNFNQEKFTNVPIRKALSIFQNKNLYCVPEPSRNKVIAWAWDGSGFNNTRMAIEIIFGIAIIYKRTLVLPPRQPWIHISDSKTCCNLEDFYDIDSLRTTFPIITAKEWFGKDVSYDHYIKFFKENNGLNLDKKESKNLEALHSLWNDFDKKLGNNNKKIWFLDMRMFSNPDDYFRHSSKLNDIRQKLFEGFKFPKKFIDISISCLSKVGITKIATYNALHIRRGDFKSFRPDQYKTDSNIYTERLLKVLDPKLPLLLITNETDMSTLNFIKEAFPRMFTMQECSNISQEKSRHIIDTLACTTATKFVGTAESTFSYYIQILRGYLSQFYTVIDDEPIFLQENSTHLVKKDDNWKCDKGCWNIVDKQRWKKLI